jgi:SAM-dependent methyltransferase
MTKVTVEIEDSILKEAMELYQKELVRRLTGELENAFDHTFGGYYRKSPHCLLSQLCDKHGSDKGAIATDGHPYAWHPHNYADIYAALFDHCRADVRRVFECGIGTNNPALPSSMGINGKPGASLRAWRDYFLNAEVVGADIDKEVLFNEDRIRTFYVDQRDPSSIRQLWDSVGMSDFDLMIDDGLHSFEAGVCLFENSFARLKSGGIYVIEDCMPSDFLKYKDYFQRTELNATFLCLFRPGIEFNDNTLILIRGGQAVNPIV